MDETAIGSVFAAFGLAAAAGLNAPLPVFASALLARLDIVQLGEPFDQLSETPGLIVLGVVLAVDLVGDKVPAVDHVLHSVGTVAAPIAGAVLFLGEARTEADLPDLISLLTGGGLAGSVHAVRAGIRPLSTVTTAGLGNTVLSAIEDLGSATLTAVAFLAPLLAFLFVIALIPAGIVIWRRRRRAR